jgi:hypothetical protein
MSSKAILAGGLFLALKCRIESAAVPRLLIRQRAFARAGEP